MSIKNDFREIAIQGALTSGGLFLLTSIRSGEDKMMIIRHNKNAAISQSESSFTLSNFCLKVILPNPFHIQ